MPFSFSAISKTLSGWLEFSTSTFTVRNDERERKRERERGMRGTECYEIKYWEGWALVPISLISEHRNIKERIYGRFDVIETTEMVRRRNWRNSRLEKLGWVEWRPSPTTMPFHLSFSLLSFYPIFSFALSIL